MYIPNFITALLFIGAALCIFKTTDLVIPSIVCCVAAVVCILDGYSKINKNFEEKGEVTMENTNNFKAFWFESNQAWGNVESLADWVRIVNAHKEGWRENVTGETLMGYAKATMETFGVEFEGDSPLDRYRPNFGLYPEHRSTLTLAEWAKNNGMYDILAKA